MATLITTNGDIVKLEPKNGTDFTLKELQDIVGGHIEIVHLNENEIMVLNEDGKLIGLPTNVKATFTFQSMTNIHDFIVGNVLICNNEQVK